MDQIVFSLDELRKLHEKSPDTWNHPGGFIGFYDPDQDLYSWYRYYERVDGYMQSGSTRSRQGATLVPVAA